MKKKLGLFLIILLACTSCRNDVFTKNMPEDFSFSIKWNVFGISSYDSSTGKLVKTTDATNPEDYITTYTMSEEELEHVYNLIYNLKIDKYDNVFNPDPFKMSSPYKSFTLSVQIGDYSKTVSAPQVCIDSNGGTIKGIKYLRVVNEISKILIDTEEWKSLPPYEFAYM